MNRSGVVLIGAATLILGYAVVYNGMSFLQTRLATPAVERAPAFPWGPLSIIASLVPGAQGKTRLVRGGTPKSRRASAGTRRRH